MFGPVTLAASIAGATAAIGIALVSSAVGIRRQLHNRHQTKQAMYQYGPSYGYYYDPYH